MLSPDGCSIIRKVGDSVARHHGNGQDYTGGKGLGQAMGKGRMVVLFLDTPNNHILSSLQRTFRAFREALIDREVM